MQEQEFIEMMGVDNEFGSNLFIVASRGKKELELERFIRFVGETTRGNKSSRLTHFLCGACGAPGLVDANGNSVMVNQEDLGRLFTVAWRYLLSKHHATSAGFDDDSDGIVSGSRRGDLYGGIGSDQSTKANGWQSALRQIDVLPFVGSIVQAAEHEAHQETEARRNAQISIAPGSVIQDDKIELSFIARWADRHVTELADAWSAFARARFFAAYSDIFHAPRTLNDNDGISEIFGQLGPERNQLQCALALASANCRGYWKRLYGSSIDGLSFHRLCHQILGWQGTTILLLRSTTNEVFGALLDEPWREWHTYFGGSSCFIFSLRPNLKICRPRRDLGARRDFMYLNTKAHKFKGIALGGSGTDPKTSRLVIPEQLGDATVMLRRSDLTFESGDLVPPSSAPDGIVSIHAIEVWGVGNYDQIKAASQGRVDARKTRAEYVSRAGKVDKAKFLQNSFDRQFLLGKTFQACASGDEYRRAIRDNDDDDATTGTA